MAAKHVGVLLDLAKRMLEERLTVGSRQVSGVTLTSTVALNETITDGQRHLLFHAPHFYFCNNPGHHGRREASVHGRKAKVLHWDLHVAMCLFRLGSLNVTSR